MPQGNSFEIVKSYRPDIGPSSAKFADIPTRSRYRLDMGMLAGKVYKPKTLKKNVVNRLCEPYFHRKTVECSSCLPFSICLKRVFSLVIDEGVSVVVQFDQRENAIRNWRRRPLWMTLDGSTFFYLKKASYITKTYIGSSFSADIRFNF